MTARCDKDRLTDQNHFLRTKQVSFTDMAKNKQNIVYNNIIKTTERSTIEDSTDMYRHAAYA